MVKLTCCDDNFAALSSNGEVFAFSPNPSVCSDTPTETQRALGSIFKPQKVWALRKKFSAVRSKGNVISKIEGELYATASAFVAWNNSPVKTLSVIWSPFHVTSELRLDCGWADKTIPSIRLIGIPSSDDQWHERSLLVAYRSRILQDRGVAVGWAPKFEGRVVKRTTIFTIQPAFIIRQPVCG
jgi:hypothetical protein